MDDKRALALLINEKGYDAEQLDYELIKRNREKKYYEITMSREMIKKQGRLMHLHHELMISRFHYMLEKACRHSNRKIELLGFYQGSSLWNTVEVPKVHFDKDGNVRELEETEALPIARTRFSRCISPTESRMKGRSISFTKPIERRLLQRNSTKSCERIFTI